MKTKVLLIEHRSHLRVPSGWTREMTLDFLRYGNLSNATNPEEVKLLKDVGSEVVADISGLYRNGGADE